MKTVQTGSTWQLVNPEALVQIETKDVNQHPRNLSGRTIVLYWNGKPNGDVFLTCLGELLLERIPSARVIKAWEVEPSTSRTDPTVEASRATAKALAGLNPDIVIGAPGDCAGCTTWLVTDQLNLERLGIPTVTVVTSPFVEMANTIPLAEGFGSACCVQVAPPIGMLLPSQIREKAENVFEEIMKAVLDWQPSGSVSAHRTAYPAETFEFHGTVEDINSYFVEKKWSLGLPILPPTPEHIKDMLDGTGRKPEEVIGQVPPGMGTLTVELAAVYAVMAGCKREYFPVLCTALEGLLDSEANLRLALCGTGTTQIIVIVNGPIIREIGIACEQGSAGKGYHANGSIGYAINLIAYAAGGSRPPFMDRSTLGSPSDYVCWVFGENEQSLPDGWQPLHVERGFEDADSVVTVMAGYPPVENMDHWSISAEEHIRWWGQIVSPLQNMGGPPIPKIMEQNPIIALGPEHAQLIASTGWSKNDFRKAFWERTRAPLSAWPSMCRREGLVEMLGPVTNESLIPITIRPKQFLIVIAGGDGKQSHYFAPIPGSFPVSKLIRR
jgi:hypothetical protein